MSDGNLALEMGAELLHSFNCHIWRICVLLTHLFVYNSFQCSQFAFVKCNNKKA